MIDLGFLTDYYIPVVVVACLIIGYCIKHITWLDKVSNQYIPTILAIVGAVLACVANSAIDLNTIVYGAFSGLASTGLHQAFTRFIKKEVE